MGVNHIWSFVTYFPWQTTEKALKKHTHTHTPLYLSLAASTLIILLSEMLNFKKKNQSFFFSNIYISNYLFIYLLGLGEGTYHIVFSGMFLFVKMKNVKIIELNYLTNMCVWSCQRFYGMCREFWDKLALPQQASLMMCCFGLIPVLGGGGI
jgi:hypothetical protein